MLLDTRSFVEYWRNFRTRTAGVLDLLPSKVLEWTHAPGKSTFGDAFRRGG